MPRIAICEDDERWRTRISVLTDEITKNHGLSPHLQVETFDNGEVLLQQVSSGASYDILLLDIEMPGRDGMDVAAGIRTRLPHLLIIFVTSHEKYVYESFRVQPYRFIPKSRMEEMLPRALTDAFSDMAARRRQKEYTFETVQGMEVVKTDEILYLWHYAKYVYLEKTDGITLKMRRNLKSITNELDMSSFVWLTRGCVCNMRHVIRIRGLDVEMRGGVRLQISRERLPEVKERLRQFLQQ